MRNEVRVRFAPSPTGYLHIGGARTALFNWLFARRRGGKFILRIEDTDRTRSTEEAIAQIIDSMSWLGLDWDEGPFRQTDHLEKYAKAADRLLGEGKAYRCYCTTEELDAMRKAQLERKETPMYDRRCSRLTEEERRRCEQEGRPPVIRFYLPDEGETVVHDHIRGDVSFENRHLDDFIMVRGDGIPTYNFAVVVDDHDMKVTHVIRGEDHLSNTPRQIQVYRALGWKEPEYAHLPMILGPDKAKLSKRHGAVGVESYRNQGFLPESMVNYLALLGWSWDEKTTIFSKDELIEKFSLERVGKTAAVFDVVKLKWMNGYYIREISPAMLVDRVVPFLERAGYDLSKVDRTWLEKLVSVARERMELLTDIIGLSDFLFTAVKYDPEAIDKVLRTDNAFDVLGRGRIVLLEVAEFKHDEIEQALRGVAEEMGLKAKQVFQPVRVAVTGRTVSLPLFESLELLGRERAIDRIAKARQLAVSTD
ncbi:MAG: glutamate--tRNA ligase [Actinobacteria bacterium]|nr:glutamate--tRNA ligase [Actinomycetota bacterium]